VRPTDEDRADAGPNADGAVPVTRPAARATEAEGAGRAADSPAARPAVDARDAKPTSRAERLLGFLLPSENMSGAIYGMIAIGALLAAESGLRDTYLETIASAMLALALYWLAHAYADLLGQRLQTRERLTVSALGRNLLHDWAIMRGGVVPLLVLLACWAAGATQETAVTVDLWVTAGSLLTFELLAGLRARASPAELLLEGCVGAAMGIGVLTLRVILH
jgi:hypothetical protein